MKRNFLLYGANGYTAGLVLDYANEYGLQPVLSGRNSVEIQALARKYGFDHVIVDLDDSQKLRNVLADFDVVLNCAGPFIYTWEKMAQACLDTGTHYLDITGEIGVFEGLHKMDKRAKERGIMLLPGIGFDVVPTDCMSAYLIDKLPAATRLQLAFHAGDGISRGTLNTAVENINNGGMIRENGKIIKVPYAYKTKTIDFGNGPVVCATIPWGDVFTAYYTTGIANIEVYMSFSRSMIRMQKWTRYISWLLALSPIKKIIKKMINKGAPGPGKEQRDQNVARVWGSVSDSDNNTHTAIMLAPNGYTLTAKTSLMAVKRILKGDFKPGFQTPSNAFGADFVFGLEGVSIRDVN